MKKYKSTKIQFEDDEGLMEFDFSLDRLNDLRKDITKTYEKQLNKMAKKARKNKKYGNEKKYLDKLGDVSSLIGEWHVDDGDGDYVTSLSQSEIADDFYSFESVMVIVSRENDESFTILHE
tara:strand:+ start:2245 stop:2607 length:363 start_codon:yes stop_codon:yes gene_type:complete